MLVQRELEVNVFAGAFKPPPCSERRSQEESPRVNESRFVELSKKFPEIVFLKVDVDQLRDVAQEWDVQAMPTFIFIKDGKAVDKVVGALKDELERKVAALATQAALVTKA